MSPTWKGEWKPGKLLAYQPSSSHHGIVARPGFPIIAACLSFLHTAVLGYKRRFGSHRRYRYGRSTPGSRPSSANVRFLGVEVRSTSDSRRRWARPARTAFDPQRKFDVPSFNARNQADKRSLKKVARPISDFFNKIGRVGMWRGGGRIGLSVSAAFVWRCLNGRAMTPFPHPAHRTGRADFPHPALGQDFTPSPTARCAQAGSDVRVRSARKGARVDSSRRCVA